MFLYRSFDIFFVIFHSCLIIFNLFGWTWKNMRRANLVTLVLTGGSWFVLGLFYGIGYCPLTEWHWQVLHKLGQYSLPDSYVSYLIARVTGLSIGLKTADTITMASWLIALIISVYMNFFLRSGRRREPEDDDGAGL